ncbi:putative FMN dependent dehydrogenase [Xylaria bambusicola]|uniref:putative FMN dependent dehydrogenase n=1 Tax=Xylaria bambusicola TaxID=326684 RepID=UPI00200794D0|nr:putative FMN dependent dehydrogenase [Xylaria bambusicola]KAI0515465.1 putative FMN dependent dehydrogenase [Xylaria bambusicola]
MEYHYHAGKRSGLNPIEYESSIYQKGLSYQRPPFTFKPLEWERLAEERMSADSKGYVVGSAGTGETANKNRAAFEKWSIIPRRLVKTERFPELSTKVLGRELSCPIACAPVGVQRIFNPDGEMAAAAAAAKQNVPYIMSTASSTPIEDVAKANGDGVRWFQLYWPPNEKNDITISMLNRAQKAGFSALFVTLDTYILGWRPSDMDNGYNPFLRSDQVGVAIGLTDPVFREHFKTKHGKSVEEDMSAAVAEWTKTVFPGHSHSFDDIKFLQQHWKGPIVLKGIQSVEDAKKCVEIGVQGIVVSNHGGRQSDGGCSSLGVLPRIVDAVGDKIDVLFDSGIRCGADIAKALALGAKSCLIGRPYIYGLALGGEEGVSHVLKALLGDLELTLHLAGIISSSPEHLNRRVLVREDELF